MTANSSSNSVNAVIHGYTGYQGNSNLKRTNVSVEWTPELVKEYIKCSQDVTYFIETYMKIINVDEGLVPFKMYDFQKEMVESMADNRHTIITTARQVGKSTTTCGFILWYILFHPEKNVAILANKAETAQEILGKVQLAYEHLPKWLQQGVIEWNKRSFQLENNSRVIASATSASAIRGYAINLLFIDEAAFIENWEEFFTSVFPTISSGKTTKIVLVSTPNGLNHFYKLWAEAQNGKNDYNAIEVHWSRVPGRDEEWRRSTLAGMGGDQEKFDQEYNVQFLGSSGTLISGWKLKELVPQYPLMSKDGLNQYKQPEENHIYAVVADTSRGKGLDYSAFQIVDVTSLPYQQVCTYRNNMITPIEYSKTLYNICKVYNNAALLVEINDIGGQVADNVLYEYGYDNILYTAHDGRAGGKKVTLGYGRGAERGIRTTKTVKSVGCSMLKLLVEQNQFIVNDFDTIRELSTFSKKGNSYEAEPGAHDDLVMCLVLFSWFTDQNFFKEYSDINTITKLRDRTEEEIMEDLLPFGVFDDGSPDEEVVYTVEDRNYADWISLF